MEQPIYDQTWRAHLQTGDILEDDVYGDYRMIGIEVHKQSSMVQYKYRALFFPKDAQAPILAINLEHNTLLKELGGGAFFLGMHEGTTHYNMGVAFDGRAEVSFDEFREEVWRIAQPKLNLRY